MKYLLFVICVTTAVLLFYIIESTNAVSGDASIEKNELQRRILIVSLGNDGGSKTFCLRPK